MKILFDLKRNFYEKQDQVAKEFSSYSEELKVQLQEETQQAWEELYLHCKQNDGFKNILQFEKLINDNKSQDEAFDLLVENMIVEVESGRISCCDFFNILEEWIKKNE